MNGTNSFYSSSTSSLFHLPISSTPQQGRQLRVFLGSDFYSVLFWYLHRNFNKVLFLFKFFKKYFMDPILVFYLSKMLKISTYFIVVPWINLPSFICHVVSTFWATDKQCSTHWSVWTTFTQCLTHWSRSWELSQATAIFLPAPFVWLHLSSSIPILTPVW